MGKGAVETGEGGGSKGLEKKNQEFKKKKKALFTLLLTSTS